MPFVVLVRLNAADLRELAAERRPSVRPAGCLQSHDERFVVLESHLTACIGSFSISFYAVQLLREDVSSCVK